MTDQVSQAKGKKGVKLYDCTGERKTNYSEPNGSRHGI
jgi:hypothetical protein